MVRHIRSMVFAALILLIAGTGAVFAQAGGGPRGGRGVFAGPGGAGVPLHALNLTEAQREQVRQVTQQHRQGLQSLFERHRTAQDARRQAIQAIPVDEARIRSVMQDLSNVEIDIALAQARIHSDIFALLTPEQQQEAQTLRAARDARMQERATRARQRLQNRAPRPPA